MTSTTSTSATSVDAALQAFHLWMGALQLARARRGEAYADASITIPQLRALSLIAASPSGPTSRELAGLLGVGASAVTPLVDRLVEHGYVQRHEDPRDRRITRLTVTDDGRARLQQMVSGKADLMRGALSRLSDDQLELVTHAFEVLRASVQPEEN